MIAGRSIKNRAFAISSNGTAVLAWRASPPVTYHKYRESLARHTGNAPTASLKVACVQIRASTGCVRAPLDTVPLRKRNGTSRRGRPWRLLRVARFASAHWLSARQIFRRMPERLPPQHLTARPLPSECPRTNRWSERACSINAPASAATPDLCADNISDVSALAKTPSADSVIIFAAPLLAQ